MTLQCSHARHVIPTEKVNAKVNSMVVDYEITLFAGNMQQFIIHVI